MHRLREIAVYSSTGTLTEAERNALQLEFDELVKAIDDIVGNTQFNTIPLLNGSHGEDDLMIQIGANAAKHGHQLAIGQLRVWASGMKRVTLSVSSPEDGAIDIVDAVFITRVPRNDVYRCQDKASGAYHQQSDNTAVNLADAESRIRDADIAEEMMNLVKAQTECKPLTMIACVANVSQQMLLQLLWFSV